MKAGLLGASYQQSALPFDAQRCVNVYAVLDQQGKDVAALYGAPGLNIFAVAGTGPGRGAFTASNGRAFEVSGNTLYEILANGTTVAQGALDSIAGIVTIDENGFQLGVCDGTDLYIFTYATNAFQKVVSPNLTLALTVTFIDGYFCVNSGGGKFQISALYDGTTWAALDFATAESSPDDLLRVLNIVGQLWLYGAKTIEIWSNTGQAIFPFAKIAGAKMETGIGATYTATPLDNSSFWVGQDNNGFGIVYRAQGFTPQRISTEPIELRIQSAPSPSTLRSYAYQDKGHTFYVITGGGMETALVYDLATQLWAERAHLNAGLYELPLQAFVIFAFGKHLAIDRTSGNIYEQNTTFQTDNGAEIPRDRIFTHLFNENERFVIHNLTVGFQVGVGTQAGQGYDPQAILFLSGDGGVTFDGGRSRPIGKVGKYNTVVKWDRLGQVRQMTFRVRVTDPVPVAMIGAWFNTGGTGGNN